MGLTLTSQILLIAFCAAVFIGAVANKTNFCTMGAISDWVNMGDTGRLRAWFFAMAIAIAGVLILELTGITDMSLVASNDTSNPPYRAAMFMWPRYILGGVLFGIGMTLASGCGNKTLVRLGGGNLKSIVVFLIMGFFAYLMMYTNFYAYLFHNWISPISIDLAAKGIPSQELGTITAGIFGFEDAQMLYYIFAGVIALAMLVWVFLKEEFRGSLDNILGGGVIGAMIVIAWYVTAGSTGQEWLSEIEWAEVRPHAAGAQSYTFVAPSGQFYNYFIAGMKNNLITFALMGALGVVLGSLTWALISRSFRFEWFSSLGDFLRHAIGAALMGIGGVLAMGCTIGQGITGVSTLSLGSFMALISIIFGCAITMKIQYYKMIHEKDATFVKALLSSLVDFKMLPASMRKLEFY